MNETHDCCAEKDFAESVCKAYREVVKDPRAVCMGEGALDGFRRAPVPLQEVSEV